MPGRYRTWGPTASPPRRRPRTAWSRRLSASPGEVLGQLDEHGLVAPITARVMCGDAAATLLDAGQHADLVVVGRRGLSGHDNGHLGTVSRRLSDEAPCAVVVVPP
jgi:nucleotide-binding universal stress UspA family protein